MANKNSTYVGALVAFLNDTKPFRSKLAEVIEEYRFADHMDVFMEDKSAMNVHSKGASLYNHFANGVSTPSPQTLIHRVVSPLFRGFSKNDSEDGAFRVSTDQNTDLPLVPFAFDPTSTDHIGLVDAFVQRQGDKTRTEPLLEGHDVFLSHGAYVFQINQSKTTDGGYLPMFAERRNEGVLAHATAVAQSQALDRSRESSAINRIQRILSAINSNLLAYPNPPAKIALDAVQAVVNTNNLPTTYETLFVSLRGHFPIIPGYTAWEDVHKALSSYTTSLYMNEYNDLTPRADGSGVGRESGALRYSDISRDDILITGVASDENLVNYEQFTLEAVSPTAFFVYGSISGLLGHAALPGVFNTPKIKFTLTAGSSAVIRGTKIELTPAAKVTIHKDAPMEAWSVIKVNPLAYSRPALKSTRYGYIRSRSGELNAITILDGTFPSGTLVLAASANGRTFSVKHTGDSSYSGTAIVNSRYNDGRIAFTVIRGSAHDFQYGDKFYVDILNEEPTIHDLDLSYGFDTGPYDGDTFIYNTVSAAAQDYLETLDFNWDSRFPFYDPDSFNLIVGQQAVHNRMWRLRAIPNELRPLLLQNSDPTNMVNLLAADDPENPDAVSSFHMDAGSTDPVPDIALWYADKFALEYYNTSSNLWVFVDEISVGASYTNHAHGLSFTLTEAGKPFVASMVRSTVLEEIIVAEHGTNLVLMDTGTGTTNLVLGEVPVHEVVYDIAGGDIIAWTIQNLPPVQTNPSALVSKRVPRLIPRGDSFFETVPAKWTIIFIDDLVYTVQGVHTSGQENGTSVFPEPLVVDIAEEGHSYRNHEANVHWTIRRGVVGLRAGDSFTFETYADRPMFLVHGSVSGWQEPASANKYYWNGKIGFRFNTPEVSIFESGVLIENGITSAGAVDIVRVRDDLVSCVYTLRTVNNKRWMLYRDGELVGSGKNRISDKFITVSAPDPIAGKLITISVQSSDYNFALGNDLAIVRTTPGRAPNEDDFVLFGRSRNDDIRISLNSIDPIHLTAFSDLGLQTVDVRNIDHSTGSNIPLSNTAPETAVLKGWIPTICNFTGDGNGEADFSDISTGVTLYAAATGELIGKTSTLGTSLNGPVYLTWDSAFAAKYMPLNSEVNIVVFGNGMNDRVATHCTESLAILMSGGGLDEDVMFRDAADIQVLDANSSIIKTVYAAGVSVVTADGPFAGFLPGYDNLPYDSEDGSVGYYDVGQGLTANFVKAKELLAKSEGVGLSAEESASLAALSASVGAYLVNGDLAATTLQDFLGSLAIDIDDEINFQNVPNFGNSALGLGVSVEDKGVSEASTSITDGMIILTTTTDGFTGDENGIGEENAAIIYANDPRSAMPSGTYADFGTALHVSSPVTAVQVSVLTALPPGTSFHVWLPGEPAPTPVTVQEISNKLFRFRLAAPSQFKLVVL